MMKVNRPYCNAEQKSNDKNSVQNMIQNLEKTDRIASKTRVKKRNV
jgi:hypothetical protein